MMLSLDAWICGLVDIDTDARYPAQGRFAVEVEGLEIEFRQMPVRDVAALGKKFDVVILMGVFYHLRHLLLALDWIYEQVAKEMLIFQVWNRVPRRL